MNRKMSEDVRKYDFLTKKTKVTRGKPEEYYKFDSGEVHLIKSGDVQVADLNFTPQEIHENAQTLRILPYDLKELMTNVFRNLGLERVIICDRVNVKRVCVTATQRIERLILEYCRDVQKELTEFFGFESSITMCTPNILSNERGENKITDMWNNMFIGEFFMTLFLFPTKQILKEKNAHKS